MINNANDSSMIFLKTWYENIMEDEYVPTSEQEMAYIMYAAAQYCFYQERIDIGEIFGKEFRGLNRSMATIYSQIDKMKQWTDNNVKTNQKYDNDKVYELAAQGKSQEEICLELGYDVSKKRSLSSNKGYRDGKAAYKQNFGKK